MKKLMLYSLSFFWLASGLSADEGASDEPYAPYKGKYALREEEETPCDETSTEETASSDEPYVPYKGKYALRDEEASEPSEEKAPAKKPYVAYKGKYALRAKEKKKPVQKHAVKKRTHHVFLEEKASYFSPISHKVRDIYAKGMGMYGFELTVPIWDFIYGWTSGSYLSKVGHSIGDHSRTRVKLIPLGIGLKFMYTVDCIDFYAGVGGLGTYFHTNDQSPFVIRSTTKWAAGGIGKLGLFIRPTKVFFIDIFGDYSYMNFKFHSSKKVVRHNVNFSGWSVGGGIGWAF
jgi:hypothetical protein